MPHARPLADRFWEKVDRRGPDECWPWTGAISPEGYGRIVDDYRRPPKYAHRIAYELVVGPIPAGLTIDHLCRNTACVNPAHLEPLPILENQRRAARRLTPASAQEIRRRRRAGQSIRAIAADLGLGRGTVGDVASGKTWSSAASSC